MNAKRIADTLERVFPEQRLFLKSENGGTRFIRLRTGTQVQVLAGLAVIVAWTIFSTSVLLMDSLSSGSAREQALREQQMYGERLNALAMERDRRAEEARMAQERFYVAMNEISAMQSRLLESEDRRKELETGIEVIQATLRRTIGERDDALARTEQLMAELEEQTGSRSMTAAKIADLEDTVDMLAVALAGTALTRDEIATKARDAEKEIDELVFAARLQDEKSKRIFQQLEDAATVILEPMDRMLRQAGLPADRLIEDVRASYSGQGGPLVPIALSTKGEAPDEMELRANEVLGVLDQANLYRLLATRLPFTAPVQSAYRFTSGFGYRRHPITGARAMHTGNDYAAPTGTPIFAAADGVVTHAGWAGGYGKLIKIQHANGYETRYAHLSRIRVTKGQRVSRDQRIADMGSTGRSTGPHLHYEIRIGGKPVNPMTYIKAGRHVF